MRIKFKRDLVIRLDRNDLTHVGFDPAGVDDAMMRKLTHHLAIAYCSSYWRDLQKVAEDAGLPKAAH